jgi:DNA mismatch repair protein MSH4
MNERAGVQNLHLAVRVSYTHPNKSTVTYKLKIEGEHSMSMLYKATQGVVKEAHYGLALARVVTLPPGVVEHATLVAAKLERHMLQNKKASETVFREKRGKLILNLKEHLVQAKTGVLEGEVLAAWLKELQKEFVNRMTALEAEAASVGQDSENEDEIMRDMSPQSEEERPSTSASKPSVMTIDSSITSTESESTMRAFSEASTIRAVSENSR